MCMYRCVYVLARSKCLCPCLGHLAALRKVQIIVLSMVGSSNLVSGLCVCEVVFMFMCSDTGGLVGITVVSQLQGCGVETFLWYQVSSPAPDLFVISNVCM